MKIAIIGGGISGCAAYLQLKKHLPNLPLPAEQHEITIYEAYDINPATTIEERNGPTHSSTLAVGGGLAVGPNGLNVLKRLDEGLLRDMVREGYSIDKQNLRTKNGTLLVRIDSTADSDPNGNMHLLGISRHSLWRTLRRRVPGSDIVNKRISQVIARPDGLNEVHFFDGGKPVQADLVIGADGVKGCTKLALFPEAKEDPYPPRYEGLVGVGGFIPAKDVMEFVEDGSMNLVFGGNGFFGYFYPEGAASSPHRDSAYHVSEPGESLGWWSTYAVDECPDPKSLDMDDVTRQLRERHAHWKDPVIQKVLASLQVKNMYPTWTSPPLPTWERDGVVLVGDAAHALPPTSGQGSSQALEDVESFALLLSHYLREVYQESSPDALVRKKAITTAANRYMELRRPRVQSILEAAQRMQGSKRNMGVLAEYAMYCALWIAGCFPGRMSRPGKNVISFNVAEQVKQLLEQEK